MIGGNSEFGEITLLVLLPAPILVFGFTVVVMIMTMDTFGVTDTVAFDEESVADRRVRCSRCNETADTAVNRGIE